MQPKNKKKKTEHSSQEVIDLTGDVIVIDISGDFNGSQATSSSSTKTRLAEEKKEEGNQLYKVKQYRDALSKYTEAIGEL